MKQKLKTQNDIFIGTDRQSGSGKSYLIRGDEKETKNEGLLDKTLETLKNEKPLSIKILPLQVYLGSTYNAFKGPEHLTDNQKITKEELLQWFNSKNSNKHII